LYYIVSNANRRFILKSGGWSLFCLNGFIGVPFHEISHLITALIFGHDITEISLFRPVKGRLDGNLGYVHYRYNPRSTYQVLGNFFVGVAPMIFGSGVMLAILLVCYPDCFNIQTSFVSELSNWQNLEQSLDRFLGIFQPENFFRMPMFWLIAFAIFVCPHLGMSRADFKCVLAGTVTLMGASLVIYYYLTTWHNFLTYEQIITGLMVFMIYYIYALLTGLIISLIIMISNGIISIIPKGCFSK
jgi:hypothetical protein